MPGEPEVPRAAPVDAVVASSVAVKHRSPLAPLLAAVVGVAVVAVAIVWFTRDSDGAAPVDVVREYITAMNVGDCTAIVDLIDTDGEPGEPDRASAVATCTQVYENLEGPNERVDLESAQLVSQDGDRATVRAELVRPGDEQPSEPDIRLVRLDGEWKIDMNTPEPPDQGDGVLGEP